METVHVKNTGRCKELLPGTAVRLEVSDNPKRKTKYDLVTVHKQGLGWVNMDSQAPNKVVGGGWQNRLRIYQIGIHLASPASTFIWKRASKSI